MRLLGIALLTSVVVTASAGLAAAQAVTLPYDHVHLQSMDQAASLAWYQQRLGGERVKFKGADALKYGDVLILVQKAKTPPAASVGHALDHVGWRVTDLDKTLADLKGIKVLQ